MPGAGGIYRNTKQTPVTNPVIDTTHAPSANSLYNYLITIGAGFGNTAYVRIGGNDTTAIVGNFLKPFATIGAAITALGTLANSALAIDAGSYNMTDVDAPFGLKAPGSKYDIICAAGCTINYFGTYGMYCMSGADGSSGNIFGLGNFINNAVTASKVVDGVANFAFNISGSPGAANYTFNTFFSQVTTGTIGLIRNGNGLGVQSAIINVLTRALCRTGTVITLDVGSRTVVTGGIGATYDSAGDFTGNNNYTVQINDPITAQFINTFLSARGTAFGMANTKCVDISNNTNGSIKFIRTTILAVNTVVGYTLINFSTTAALSDNTLFQNCILQNRQNTTFASAGVSFNTAVNISFKIVDTYSEKNAGGAGTITNLIATGNGFMVEPNIV
jgi:hypothetical protein